MKTRTHKQLLAALIMVTSLSWSGLRAQVVEDQLADLLSEALTRNPKILAAQKRYEAARQRPSQESSLPDPMFSPGYNSNGAPWPGAKLGIEPTSQIGFMVSQKFPFPGKRKLDGSIAEKEADAEWEQYQQAQLEVVSRIKQAYFRRAFAFDALDVLERNIEALKKFIQIAEARYEVGQSAQQDVFNAQTQLSILETRRIQLERDKRAREAEINSLVNRLPGSTLSRPPRLRPLELQVTLEDLYASARQNSPLLMRDQKMIERAELAVNRARKEYYPDFTINGGYYYMGQMPDMFMLRADFEIPLYFFRKQRPGVAEKAQLLTESRRLFESTNQDVHFRIQDEFLGAESSLKLAQMYGQAVIPQANLTLESSLFSYETGAVDFLTVFNNYMTVVEYEMNYFEELQNAHLALARLEEMTALPLIN